MCKEGIRDPADCCGARLPENHASHRLLLKSGFREEGMARAYLKINGSWRDHLLFGMVSPGPHMESGA